MARRKKTSKPSDTDLIQLILSVFLLPVLLVGNFFSFLLKLIGWIASVISNFLEPKSNSLSSPSHSYIGEYDDDEEDDEDEEDDDDDDSEYGVTVRLNYYHNRYKSESGKYKFCPDCSVRNPVERMYCLECSHDFQADSSFVRNRSEFSRYVQWMSHEFYTPAQRSRFRRALQKPLPILKYDSQNKTFTVASSNGNDSYKVTPSSCTCEDFQNRHLPCKHMFSVMLNEGYISGDVYMYRMPKDLYTRVSDCYRSSPQAASSFSDYVQHPLTDSGLFFADLNCSMYSYVSLLEKHALLIQVPQDLDSIVSYVFKSYTVDSFREVCRTISPEIHFPSLKKRDMIYKTLESHDDLRSYFSSLFVPFLIHDEIFENQSDVCNCVKELST